MAHKENSHPTTATTKAAAANPGTGDGGISKPAPAPVEL